MGRLRIHLSKQPHFSQVIFASFTSAKGCTSPSAHTVPLPLCQLGCSSSTAMSGLVREEAAAQPSSLWFFCDTHIYKEFDSINGGAGLLRWRLEWPKQSYMAQSLGTQLLFLICGTELLCCLDISFCSGPWNDRHKAYEKHKGTLANAPPCALCSPLDRGNVLAASHMSCLLDTPKLKR